MSEPPSAEAGGAPQYRAVMFDAGGVVIQILILASDDDAARSKARALVDGHALDLWDELRFIERFEPAEVATSSTPRTTSPARATSTSGK